MCCLGGASTETDTSQVFQGQGDEKGDLLDSIVRLDHREGIDDNGLGIVRLGIRGQTTKGEADSFECVSPAASAIS